MRLPVYQIVSIGVFFLIWAVAAQIANSVLLPGPVHVFAILWDGIRSGELTRHLSVTLWRVSAAFILAMSIGVGVGLLMGRSNVANKLGDPWLIIFLNIPALVVIILAYVWFGLTEAVAIGAVAVNKIPNVAVTIREGARSLDRRLDEMADVYRFTFWQRLVHVTLPQLQPYIAAAARSGLSLIWKIVLVVEMLGRSSGIGFQIHLFFQLFDVASILAYSFSFTAIMLLIELLIVQPYERYATRWRLNET